MKKGFIFDLDGVIVDTAHSHYLAWKKVAEEVGFTLTEELNEELKGISRVDSLKRILEWTRAVVEDEQFEEMMARKNADYLSSIANLKPKDILPGVLEFIEEARKQEIPLAIGSASKNAPGILTNIGLYEHFDVIIDGNEVSVAKPDPEIFLVAALRMQMPVADCIVFEDSAAGIEAANTAGMTSVGVGDPRVLKDADFVFPGFDNVKIEMFFEK